VNTVTTAPKNWLERNWKWAVPTGCLGMLVLFAAGLALLAYLAFGMIRNSEVCKEAIARARSSQVLVDALGTPIEIGWLVSGSINTNGPSGRAELAAPLSGPKGSGTLYLKAVRQAGEWTFSVLVVELEDKRRVDLLTGQVRPGPGSAWGGSSPARPRMASRDAIVSREKKGRES